MSRTWGEMECHSMCDIAFVAGVLRMEHPSMPPVDACNVQTFVQPGAAHESAECFAARCRTVLDGRRDGIYNTGGTVTVFLAVTVANNTPDDCYGS